MRACVRPRTAGQLLLLYQQFLLLSLCFFLDDLGLDLDLVFFLRVPFFDLHLPVRFWGQSTYLE